MKYKNQYNKKMKIFYLCISLVIFFDALFELLLSISISGGLFYSISYISILFHLFVLFITGIGIFYILKSEIVIQREEIKFYEFSKICITKIFFSEIEGICAKKNIEINDCRFAKDSVVIVIFKKQKKYKFAINEKDFLKLKLKLQNQFVNTGDGSLSSDEKE